MTHATAGKEGGQRHGNAAYIALFVALQFAVLTIRLGLLLALIVVGATVGVFSSAIAFWLWQEIRRESSLRRKGCRPSWPARMTSAGIRAIGGQVSPGRRGIGTLAGYLSYHNGAGYSWRPSARVRRLYAIDEVVWGNDWGLKTTAFRGPGRPGCVEFFHADGRVATVWIRHLPDFLDIVQRGPGCNVSSSPPP